MTVAFISATRSDFSYFRSIKLRLTKIRRNKK